MSITTPTVKVLWTRAHNCCAFPTCFKLLAEDSVDATTGDGFVTIVGKQAHIRSPKADGPRHDPGAGRAQVVQHVKGRLAEESDENVRTALLATLRRHADPKDNLADWWWGEYDQTWAWFQVASHLGIPLAFGPWPRLCRGGLCGVRRGCGRGRPAWTGSPRMVMSSERAPVATDRAYGRP